MKIKLLVIAATLMLSACASIPNPISADIRRDANIVSYSIEFPEEDGQSLASRDSIAFNEKLDAVLREKMEQDVFPKFRGGREINVKIDVSRIIIPSLGMAYLVGSSPSIEYTVIFEDKMSGAELGRKQVGFHWTNTSGLLGGVLQRIGGIADTFAKSIAVSVDQLLTKEELSTGMDLFATGHTY